ncbi:HAD family phosphatase [Streptomyces griseoviridis]|uniref:HAD family hydrolase n=1 Tax=Streptomyces griseoviridis TaxID=45398 RepID=UPI00344CA423
MEPSRSAATSMVVWDLGGVLAPSGRALPALAAALDLPEDDLAGPYWNHRDPYDLGEPSEAYWARVGRDLGRPLDRGWAERLDRVDTGAWTVLADDAGELLGRLAGRGTPQGVLSNAPASLATAVRGASWSGVFETLVFSADLGVMKPDPRVYRAADDRFGRRPADIVFFDDRPENVEAARAHGWRAHAWTGGESAAGVLADEGLLTG